MYGQIWSWDKPGLFFFVNWTCGQVREENRQAFLTIELGLFFLSSLVAKQIKLHNFVDFNMMDPIRSSYVWAIRCLQAHNSHPPKHTQYLIWFWILHTSYCLVKVHPMLGLPFQPWAVGSTSYTWASPPTTIALVYKPKIWKDNKGKRFLANFKQCGPMWATSVAKPWIWTTYMYWVGIKVYLGTMYLILGYQILCLSFPKTN
jgi:hypothetical protein